MPRTRNLVLRASRQVEKSTFSGGQHLVLGRCESGHPDPVCLPATRTGPVVCADSVDCHPGNSPILRGALVGNTRRHLPVTNLKCANGSNLFVRAAYRPHRRSSRYQRRQRPADRRISGCRGRRPAGPERNAFPFGRRADDSCGTPKLIDNHLETMFNQSTANEWQISCPSCGHDVVLDERSIGPTGIMCPQCQSPLDKFAGRWVPRNPHATWGDGYWINALMVPWRDNPDELLECQRTYDLCPISK